MHTMTINDKEPRIPAGKLALGLVLLAFGVATFLEAVDLWDSGPLWSYWPLILIAIGGANEIDAIRRRRSDGSYVLLGIGIWMFAGAFRVFGLSYGQAFPIALIVAGLGVVLHAVIDAPLPAAGNAASKENEHERQ
jgi:hypothetical protein